METVTCSIWNDNIYTCCGYEFCGNSQITFWYNDCSNPPKRLWFNRTLCCRIMVA